MIYADMSFWHMAGLGLLITFAIFGVISFAVLVFRVMNSNDAEYYEEDEYDFHGWENPEMIPVRPERKTAKQEKKPVKVEYINIFDEY